MTSAIRVGALALTMALAGCSDGLVYGTDARGSYMQTDMSGGAEIFTTGSRFGLSRDQANAKVAAAMPEAFVAGRFSPAQGGRGSGNRIVWRFAADRGVPADRLCNSVEDDLPAGPTLTAGAAFCRGPSALIWTNGRLDRPVTSFDDPALQALIRSMTLDLTTYDGQNRFPTFD